MSDLAPTAKLDIGRVIQQTFAVLGRNFVTFLILAGVLIGLPAVLVGYLQMSMFRGGATIGWQSAVSFTVAAVGGLILNATITYGTVQDLNGRRPAVSDALGIGLRTFLPLLLIGILFYLAFMVGFVLLIAPGLMLLSAWAITFPVYVVERPALTRSFARSAELTRGNRWRVLGLLLLYFAALIVIEIVFGLFAQISTLSAGRTSAAALAAAASPFRMFVITPLIATANGLLTAAGVAALYVELRRLKDGVGPEGLAAIFD